MKAYIVFIDPLKSGRKEADRLEGQTFDSLQELKGTLANDGVGYFGISPMHEFTEEWNDSDGGVVGLQDSIRNTFITHIYVNQ